MKKINLDGYVGMDITVKQVAEALALANGDDIEVRLNTPGGLLSAAREIYQQIRDYPGKKTLLLGGTVASAGTFIAALENADIAADASTAYMIHNATTFADGDHREMVKTADYLRKATKNIADRLASMSKKPVDEIIDMMNEETWLYGQEIVDAGFANRLTGVFQQANKDEAIARAKAEILATAQIMNQGKQEPKPEPKEEKKMDVKEATDFLKSQFTPEELDKRFALQKPENKEAENALAENVALKEEIKANAEAVRQAVLTEAFNADGEKNVIRKYADKITTGLSGQALKDAINKIKTEDPVAKTIAGQMADGNSALNTLEAKKEPGPEGVRTVVC
jgi:ATP-dependent Clp protease protease subunit